MTSRVTVAIPTYNGARFLRESITSILGQTCRELTVICIDDASSDDSAGVAESVGVRVARNPSRIGLAANWNRALDLCETEFLVIAHQDDVYAPQFIERMIETLDRHPPAFAAHCKSTVIDEDGREIEDPAALFKERFWPRGKKEVEAEITTLRNGNYVIAPAVMMRMPAAGRFNETYEFVTDWDYWLRGLLDGKPMIGLNERLVSFRRHAETATLASERSMRRYEEELQLLREIDERVPATHPYRALENNLLTGFARRLADGDRDGARTLLRFGVKRVPSFSRSARARLMRSALPFGKAGGALLRTAERLFLRLYNRQR
jgi:glycosyltransferase involved in cell wall biosynthesis